MKHYIRRDLYAGRRATGRTLTPNQHLYLNEMNNTNSRATNIVGGIGYYSITAHVYAEGTPGESLDLTLIWQDTTKNPRVNSPHFVERLVFDKNGKINANVEFKRHVSRGYAVYARLRAPSTNKNNVKVTMFASDAYLYN